MNTPKMAGLTTLGVVFVASLIMMTLASCSVTPNGPVSVGATHGALAGDAMCDWYYRKSAGWTYAFSNVEHIYNADGTVTTRTGAPDTVRAIGYSGIAPNGDSLYRFAITYRVATAYAGRGELTMNFMLNCNNGNGAWVEPGYDLGKSMVTMGKKPRPVSTDTILAGLVGRIRTMTDDFSNSSAYTWQIDTIWASAHNDSVFVWEYPTAGATSTLKSSRCVFARDFVNNTNSNGNGSNVNWMYDLMFQTTGINVENANTSVVTPMATFSSTAKLKFTTQDPSIGAKDRLPTSEFKFYTFGIGVTSIQDEWWVTTDGTHFTKHDFTRSLVSLTR